MGLGGEEFDEIRRTRSYLVAVSSIRVAIFVAALGGWSTFLGRTDPEPLTLGLVALMGVAVLVALWMLRRSGFFAYVHRFRDVVVLLGDVLFWYVRP